MFPFKLACVEEELATSKHELRDITKMYIEAEESRQRHVVGYVSLLMLASLPP